MYTVPHASRSEVPCMLIIFELCKVFLSQGFFFCFFAFYASHYQNLHLKLLGPWRPVHKYTLRAARAGRGNHVLSVKQTNEGCCESCHFWLAPPDVSQWPPPRETKRRLHGEASLSIRLSPSPAMEGRICLVFSVCVCVCATVKF